MNANSTIQVQAFSPSRSIRQTFVCGQCSWRKTISTSRKSSALNTKLPFNFTCRKLIYAFLRLPFYFKLHAIKFCVLSQRISKNQFAQTMCISARLQWNSFNSVLRLLTSNLSSAKSKIKGFKINLTLYPLGKMGLN
jgi:hypothetical protein